VGAAVHVLRSPGPDAALHFLRAELHRGLVQVVGLCEVRYQGRAQSTLSLGERLLLLKPDGALLVHTATRVKPVNWQPPGARFAADVEEGTVVVTSTRGGKGEPDEVVRIALRDVQLLASFALRDDESLALLGSEADLAELLAQRPELLEPGLQVAQRERDNGRGPMDLACVDARGQRVVVELKRKAAGLKEAEQLRRYVERERAAKGSVRGMLVATAVSEPARRYLRDQGLEWKEVDWAELLPLLGQVLPAGQRTLQGWQG
jgi:RecB family endonuclease NucS